MKSLSVNGKTSLYTRQTKNNRIRPLAAMLLSIFFATIFHGCKDEIVYQESPGIGSIYVDGITGNIIPVHTGETFQVKMNILPPDALPEGTVLYLYESGDNRVFIVDANGVVSGVKPGEAVLYVTSSNYPDMKTAAMVSVTDRFYPVTGIDVDERLQNLTMAVGDEMDIGNYIAILPENASNSEFSLESSNREVLEVTGSGSLKALAPGNAVLTIRATDGSNIKVTCDIWVKAPVYVALDRSVWTVIPSHNLPEDTAIRNAPESLIDGNVATCLSMVKPGKNYGGIPVGADEEVFFVIDMKEKSTFNYFKIFHRTSNTQPYLRVWGVSLYGSNDGETFEPIRENIPVEYENVKDCTVRIMDKSDYRYLKVLYTDWNPQSGNTIQIAEFELGLYGFDE